MLGRASALHPREGTREGRRPDPPPAPAPAPTARGGRGGRRVTAGTTPERRNQFGRSRGAEGKGRQQRTGADAGGGRRGAIGEPREPGEPPPTGHASRGRGPVPVRHEALARRPAPRPGGGQVLSGRAERRAPGGCPSRGPRAPGKEGPGARNPRPAAPGPPPPCGGQTPGVRDAVTAAVRVLGLLSSYGWDLGEGAWSLRGLGDGKAQLAGQAAQWRGPWGFHLPARDGTRGRSFRFLVGSLRALTLSSGGQAWRGCGSVRTIAGVPAVSAGLLEVFRGGDLPLFPLGADATAPEKDLRTKCIWAHPREGWRVRSSGPRLLQDRAPSRHLP